MKTKSIILFLVMFFISIPSIADDMLQKSSAPISVDIPTKTLVKTPIHIKGTTIPKIAKVKIKILYPEQNNNPQKSWTLKASVKDNGTFNIDFTNTQEAGKYEFTIFSPDKKKSINKTCYVQHLTNYNKNIVKEFINSNKVLIDTVNKKIDILKKNLSKLPQSPATIELKDKLTELSNQISKGESKVANLEKPLEQMTEFIGKNKDYPELTDIFTPIFESLDESSRKLEQEREILEEKFNKFASKKPTKCDDIDKIVTGLEFATGSVQVMLLAYELPTKGLIDVLKLAANQALELTNKTLLENYKTIPGGQKSIPSSEVQYAKSLINYVTIEGKKPEDWGKNSVALINSAVSYASGNILEKYCVKYTGDFNALFVAQFYAYKKDWWSYSIKLKGKLNLRYEKGASAGAVRVSGEFEGNAVDFEVWDDLMSATPYMNRHVAFHATFPPLITAVPGASSAGQAVANEFGKMGRYGFGPYAFLVPVHGIIDKNKMILKVDKAVKDYGDNVKGTALYVLVEPSLPIPYVMIADLKMVKAGFIISRAVRGKAVFDVKIDKKRATIKKTFTRTEKADNGEYKVNWLLKVKACNPECLK